MGFFPKKQILSHFNKKKNTLSTPLKHLNPTHQLKKMIQDPETKPS
jgi:hypothetical protein